MFASVIKNSEIMAKYKNGPMGSFSGKIGNVVGSSWRSVDYMRSLPEQTSKVSPAQLNQRLLMGMVSSWLKPLRDLIWIGYQSFNGTQTPMNGATSFILKEAITGTAPDYQINFERVIFSRGELLVSLIKEVSFLPNGLLQIKWENGPASMFCKDTDQATFIIYNVVKNKFVTYQQSATRAEKEVKLVLPESFANDTIHCWMQYVNTEGNAVSTSVYVGKILIRFEG